MRCDSRHAKYDIVVVRAAFVLLNGSLLCAAQADDVKAKEAALPAATTPAVVALYGKACPMSGVSAQESPTVPLLLLGALVQTVGPVLVDHVVTNISDLVQREATELSASTTASRNGILFRKQTDGGLKLSYQCVIVARGKFGPFEKIAKEPGTPFSTSELRDLHPAIHLVTSPDLYIEMQIDYRKLDILKINGTTGNTSVERRIVELHDAFRLKPVYLSYNESGAKRNRGKEKQIILELTVDLETEDGKSRSIYSTTIDFGSIPFKSVLKAEALDRKDPPFQTLPQPGIVEKTVVIAGGGEARVQSLNLHPIRVTVQLTETEPGGDVERLVAQAIRDNRKKLEDPLLDYVNRLIDEKIKQSAAGSAK